jgi:hypothetical protein
LKKLNRWLIKLLLGLIKALEKSAKESTPKTPQKVKMPTNNNTEVKGVSLLRLPRESATREYVHLLVKDVTDRSYILVHIGNRAKDTRGCILVGQSRKQDFVGNSTLAMELLIKEIIHLGGKNINIIIKNK